MKVEFFMVPLLENYSLKIKNNLHIIENLR